MGFETFHPGHGHAEHGHPEHCRTSRGRHGRRHAHGHPHNRGRGRGRAGRGDLRNVVLVLLAEESMHGYQLITEISERTNEQWAPSAGAIYPTLNLLEDEGLITVTKEAGRKLARLTETGTRLVAENPEWATIVDRYANPEDTQDPAFLRRGAMHRLRNAVKSRGSADDERVIAVLNQAAEKIEKL